MKDILLGVSQNQEWSQGEGRKSCIESSKGSLLTTLEKNSSTELDLIYKIISERLFPRSVSPTDNRYNSISLVKARTFVLSRIDRYLDIKEPFHHKQPRYSYI